MCKGLSRSFKDRSFHLHSPYVRDHYFLESLKEKSWIERPGKWSKGPKAAKPFPATWKRRACSGNWETLVRMTVGMMMCLMLKLPILAETLVESNLLSGAPI